MLQRAVDIHFELNYKHLCSSPASPPGEDDQAETSPIKDEETNEVMVSSLANEFNKPDDDKNQILSSTKANKKEYVPKDYDDACV